MIDSLDKLVQLAQISGGVNVQCRFEEKWFVKHQYQPQQAIVHIVVKGQGYVKIDGETQSRALQDGDILFFSRAQPHILSHQSSCENRQDQPLSYVRGKMQIKQRGLGRDFTLFCAHFYYDKRSDLFQNLPEFFHTRLADTTLAPIINLLQQEVEQPQFGSQQVIDSLSNVLLIAIVRAYLKQQPAEIEGVLSGIYDPRLSAVLDNILSAPEQDWSVEKIVSQSHLSRAQLMRVFKQKIGLSPHHFVLRTRLQKAAVLLKQSSDSVLAIALSCGFSAEAHFIKAFKNLYGVTPSVYRKTQNENALPDHIRESLN